MARISGARPAPKSVLTLRRRPRPAPTPLGTLARWADRLPSEFNVVEKLADLAHDEDPRVRLAAIVAAGNIQRPESMVVVLSAASATTRQVHRHRAHRSDGRAQAAMGTRPRQRRARLETRVARPHQDPRQTQAQARPREKSRPANGHARSSPSTAASACFALHRGQHQCRGRHRPTAMPSTARKSFTVAESRLPDLPSRSATEGGNIGPSLDAIGSAQPARLHHRRGPRAAEGE